MPRTALGAGRGSVGRAHVATTTLYCTRTHYCEQSTIELRQSTRLGTEESAGRLKAARRRRRGEGEGEEEDEVGARGG